jgi:hypothetical protein
MTLYVQTSVGEIWEPHGDWQKFTISFIPGNYGAMPCVAPGSEQMDQDDNRVVWLNRAFIVKVWHG